MVEHKKVDKKIEFDIIENGVVVRRVSNGVLVEAADKTIKYHWGGSMFDLLFVVTLGLIRTIGDLKAMDMFKEYVIRANGEKNNVPQ